MLDVIKLLPDHVANQIAAGEVIQRPASVVKELLENAVDAGSTHIVLHIKDGGRTLIQVIDNGCGMSETDARMSWERHATSKISNAEDLFRLNTKGFRGEALASIAAISFAEMKTRRLIDDVAVKIEIQGTEVVSVEPLNAPVGTSISVKNLFFNVPARRQFLKSNPVETKYIIDEFLRVALVHPEIGFEFYNNDNEVFNLKSGSIEKRVLEVFADKKSDDLIYVEESTSVATIKGFVGVPSIAKKTRGEQFLFVNKRFFKDGYLNHAIVSAFKDLITKDVFPFYVFYFQVNPATIDVNVHPQKTEIKFEDERIIYQFLHAVTRKALGSFMSVPEAEFNMDPFTVNANIFAPPPKMDTQTGFNPFKSTPYQAQKDWKKLFEPGNLGPFNERFDSEQLSLPEENTIAKAEKSAHNIPVIESFWQYQQSYIFAQSSEGLYILDQEKCHERIVYEEYLQAMDGKQVPSQERLFPQLIDLQISDFELIHDMLPMLSKLGFDLAIFGKNSLIINGIPAGIKNINERHLIENMLDDYKQTQVQAKGNRLEILSGTLARRTCIKHGDKLSVTEMTHIFNSLFKCQIPNYDISGNKTYKKINHTDFNKMFV